MPERVFNVLILCTGNSARSILGEALINRMGRGRFRAYSAGSQPAGRVNPLALELLQERGFPTAHLRSKNWSEFEAADAPRIDFVFTVCDNAAAEQCPVWPGHPVTAHWGIADPAAARGDEEQRRQAFRRAYTELEQRVKAFVSLPLEQLDANSLQRRLDEIGRGRSQGG